MSVSDEAGELPPLEVALGDELWDSAFWERFSASEDAAKEALMALYDSAYEGYGCSCDTCVVRTVLEAVWPELTNQFHRLLATRTPVQTMSGGCSGSCKRCRSQE